MAKSKPAAKPAPAAKSAKAAAKGGKAKGAKPNGKSITKSELYKKLVEHTGLERKQVVGVFDALRAVIAEQMKPAGPGVLTLPGLVKLTRFHKDAVPAGPWFNPMTKTTVDRKAKPAQTKIKVRPLKDLQAVLAK